MLSKELKKNYYNNVFPAIISLLAAFIYSFVDGIIVGQGVGTDALGSVLICFPFILISTAIFCLASVGGSSIAAIFLGNKEYDNAQNVFMHSFILSIILGAFITLLGVMFSKQIVIFLGANDTYLNNSIIYLKWWAIFAIPASIDVTFLAFCRNGNAQKLAAKSNIISTLINLILDSVFVFVFKMGIFGAIIATGFSQVVTLLVLLTYFLNKESTFKILKYEQNIKTYKDIIIAGIPEAVGMSAGPYSIFLVNKVFIKSIGNVGFESFAIVSNMLSIIYVFFSGTAQGIQPLLGTAYGAKKYDEDKAYFRFSIFNCIIYGIVFILLNCLFTRQIAMLFGAKEDILNFLSNNILKFIWGVCFSGINTIVSVYLYATGKIKRAIVYNVLRGFIIITIVIFVLPKFFGTEIIFHTLGIQELIMTIIGVFILK